MAATLRVTPVVAALMFIVGCSGGDSEASTPTSSSSDSVGATTSSTASATTSIAATTTSTTVAVAPQWTWAWQQDPAQIVAVDTNGHSNVLVDTPDPTTLNNFGLWQVGDETAVAMYMAGDTPTAFSLTPTTATQVDFPAVEMAVPSNGWSLVAVSDPYLVIRYFYGVSEAAVLINSATAQATLLSANTADLPWAARFSADGQYLRFVTTSGDGTSSNVMERDLTTGTDRTVYSYSNYDHVRTDANGDVWIDFRTGDVIAADGSPTNNHRSNDSSIGLWLTGDRTMTYSYACETDCPLTLTPISGSAPAMTYVIPQKTATRGVASWLLADQSLLVLDSETSSYWRLPLNGVGELLGHGDSFQSSSGQGTARYVVFSTDVGDPVTYDSLLNVATGEIIPLPSTAATQGEFSLEFQRAGLLLTQYKSDGGQSIWLMPYDTQSFALLTTDSQTYCPTVLSDGSAICYSYASSGAGAIYRYDTTEGALTRVSDLVVYSLAEGQ
ncbi:MAG: hypothetical protein K8R99_05845 [Actinomycetia bacterium]|nr:hypothetical protein [Actinomycetes bacterium]